jgi:UPF0271 protein
MTFLRDHDILPIRDYMEPALRARVGSFRPGLREFFTEVDYRDPQVMRKTVALAHENSVAVGAHPGLPDLVGFGRRKMDVTPDDAYAMVVYQVGALKAFVEARGMVLHHVKPHGALYVMLHDQEEVAAAVAEAIRDTCPAPLLYWPAPVEMHALPRAARKLGIDVVGEVYFDLAYSDEGEARSSSARRRRRISADVSA